MVVKTKRTHHGIPTFDNKAGDATHVKRGKENGT